jgi:ankyrin repeat protein
VAASRVRASLADSPGARPAARRQSNNTALHMAAQASAIGCVQELLQRGAKADAKNMYEKTALLLLDPNADYVDAAVQSLAEAGADLNAADYTGYTKLHWNARVLSSEARSFASALLDAGANVNAASSEGVTPLMLAAEDGAAEMVALLVERGADKSAKNGAGKTALDLAREAEREEDVLAALA